MAENDKKNVVKALPIYLFLAALLSVSLWAIWQRRATSVPVEVGSGGILSESLWADPEDSGTQVSAGDAVIASNSPVEAGGDEAVETEAVGVVPGEAVVGAEPEDAVAQAAKKAALEEIFANRGQWDPVGANWFGKEVNDFSFRSIDDEKILKLSDYRGKDVILAFWATWCPPCKLEIPHLMELRESISEDDLEIIAISNEDVGLIKSFVANEGINYTVSSVRYEMPAPFSFVSSIPTTFYINEDGVIEVIATGVVSTEDAKAIMAVSE